MSVWPLALVSLLFFSVIDCKRADPPVHARSQTINQPKVSSKIFFGDTLVQSKLVHYVRPQYPAWARRKHLEGTVEIKAMIDKDGRVRDLVFLSGPKALAPYAEAAARKWRYKPLIFNGTPVDVKTDILVPFFLNR